MPPCEIEKSNNKYLNIHISQYKQAENGATDTTQKVHKLTKWHFINRSLYEDKYNFLAILSLFNAKKTYLPPADLNFNHINES